MVPTNTMTPNKKRKIITKSKKKLLNLKLKGTIKRNQTIKKLADHCRQTGFLSKPKYDNNFDIANEKNEEVNLKKNCMQRFMKHPINWMATRKDIGTTGVM